MHWSGSTKHWGFGGILGAKTEICILHNPQKATLTTPWAKTFAQIGHSHYLSGMCWRHVGLLNVLCWEEDTANVVKQDKR